MSRYRLRHIAGAAALLAGGMLLAETDANPLEPGEKAAGEWIKVRLEGTKSNRSAIGARVVLRFGGKVQVQGVLSQASYVSANDPRLHFGLGGATSADIEVYWPMGSTEKFPAQGVDRLVTIREGHGIVQGRPFSAR